MVLNKTYGGFIDLSQVVLNTFSIANEVLVLNVGELDFFWSKFLPLGLDFLSCWFLDVFLLVEVVLVFRQLSNV